MLDEIGKQILNIFKKDPEKFNSVEWCAFYDKYGDECLCFKDGNWNWQVANLVDRDLFGPDIKELKPFHQWLGERIELCLNAQIGKSNAQIKQELSNLDSSER